MFMRIVRYIKEMFSAFQKSMRTHEPGFNEQLLAQQMKNVLDGKPNEYVCHNYTYFSLWNDFDKRASKYEYCLTTSSSRGILCTNDDTRLNYWIGSISYDGRDREACLKYLIDNYVLGDENRILLRLTDWVPHIRSRASKWVVKNFEGLNFSVIQLNDRLIQYLSRKEMLVNTPAMRIITKTIGQHLQTISMEEFFTLNASFRKYLYLSSLDTDQCLRKWILHDKEPFNRLLLINHNACENLTSNEVKQLKADKSVFVRRQYMYSLIKNGAQPSQTELTECAMDSNKSLRNFGQFYLKKYYGVDAYELYKNSEGNTFYCISDYGKAEDLEHFLKGISTSDKRTKVSCLRAAHAINPDTLHGVDLKPFILMNKNSRKFVSALLPTILDADELIELRSTFIFSSPNGLKSYLSVIERKSFWLFVDIALKELADNSLENIGHFIQKRIWSHSSVYEVLSDDLRESINSTLEHVDGDEFGKLIHQVNFLMGN